MDVHIQGPWGDEDEGVGHDCNHEDQEDHGDEDEDEGGEATVGHDPDTS